MAKTAKRRRFSEDQIQKILDAYTAAAHGKKGAVLRKFRVESAHIAYWKRTRQ